MVQSYQARRHVARDCGEVVKLGRSPGLKPVRDERSSYCIYAYVEKQSEATVNQLIDPIDNACDLLEKSTATLSSLRQIDEYARSSVMMALEISPGESRGYWKYHDPDKKFKQSKAMGKINNKKSTLLFDSGAEVSILDATFARKIDESQALECEGVGRSPYTTEGRTHLKITLAGSLVYFFEAWVGPPTGGQDLILGMDFMVLAGIRLDLADGTICLPDEVRLQMAGRRPLYGDKIEHVCWKDHYWIDVGQTAEIKLRSQTSNQITRGDRWVPTITIGPGKTRYLQVTNVSDRALTHHEGSRVAMWLSGDRIPRIPGYVSVGSRRYAEWQNLAYQTTTDEISEVDINERITEPAVERPEYVTPTAILPRSVRAIQKVEIAGDGDASPPSGKGTSDQSKIDSAKSDNLRIKIEANIGDPTMDEEVCIKEGGILFAEDVEDQMAVLPEVTVTTEEVKIEDLQIGDAEINTQEEIECLVQIIWKRKHLLIGKGNGLPPAANEWYPVAQRCCKVAIQFREKLYQLIKGLLSARMIRHSTSPWASPIVVIIKKNRIDIRLCIDYRLVNSLTRLMVYPMPLINDLLDDLDKVLWYCSLDMVSGFWVVPMTDRARSISAFITPFGLFEWNRMPSTSIRPKGRIRDGEPDLERNESVLGRRSYIDDILVTGRSWDVLCEKVEELLDACDEWNLSITVTKSFWGRQKVEYLGHRVSAEGLETHPKDLAALQELSFPANLRSMQSFLGSLNYYSRFIEEFATYASVLYELHEADFYEIARKIKSTGDDKNVIAEEGGMWTEARTAFAILKNKIVTAPILLHFDVDRQPVVVVSASKWAISPALMQEHDGIYKPVTFTSRTLKPNEINYGMVDKEDTIYLLYSTCDKIDLSVDAPLHIDVVTSLIRIARTVRTVGCTSIKLDPRGRQMYQEGEILGVIAASITPRKEVDSILISIAPRKQPRQVISMPPPTVEPDERLLVVSFDGLARVKRSGGAYSGIVWSLPEWTVISAASKYQLDLTVNEAEYHDMDRGRLIICGDSNLVIRQRKGEIECKAPGLTLLRQQALERLRSWPNHEFLHMKRDWNQSADSLASAALRRENGVVIVTEEERQDLVTLNRLDELLIAKDDAATVKIAAVTRSRKKCRPQVLQEEIVQRMRMERINQAQDEEKWIVDLKDYLRGDVQDLTSAEAKSCSKIAGLLFYFPPTRQSDEDRILSPSS
ncbi:Reverse transcriptase [Phytophthora palmivora]|uniref:Reverse transcriptase n=1 Tax=Phytophthora palmivora TaxID=4796 RepID=A0A2P4XTN2_9STRA|nr:Reverse transcriptase [Phytophthora palmivora]